MRTIALSTLGLSACCPLFQMTSVPLIVSLVWMDLVGFMAKNAIGQSGSTSDYGPIFELQGGSTCHEYGLSPMLE